MAKKIGLSATLRFMAQGAITGMRKAAGAFGTLRQAAQRAKAGMSDVNAGLRQVGQAGLIVAGAAGVTVKRLADFEGAFGAVKAVIGKKGVEGSLLKTQAAFVSLRERAQQLGESTQFTATQAAQAMESLARAGLKPNQILTAIGPVLNAAAAEGIDLASAADIASKNMKAFGLTTKDIPRIVDTLAFVSRNTNSTMMGLQEGLKLVSSSAKAAQVSFGETTKVLGILNDVGLNNTMAGTALNNALVKIAANAKNGVIPIFGDLSAQLVKNKDGSTNLTQTMFNVLTALKQTKDPVKRLNIAMKLFGIRGAKGALAFERLLSDGKIFNKLFGKGVNKAIKGTAKEMAKMRLDNIHGDFVLLSSAADGLAQSFAMTFSSDVRKGVKGLTSTFSQAAAAFKAFTKNPKLLKGGAVVIKDINGKTKTLNNTVADSVRGVVMGVKELRTVLSSAAKSVVNLGRQFGLFGKGGAKESARTITKVLGVAAALGVVGASLKLVTTLFGGMARAGIGAAKLVGAALMPLAKATGGVFGAIAKRFPLLAKGAGKIPGALGKGFRFLDNITAMPVRVVNMPLGGLGGVAGAAATAGGGFRAGLNSLVAGIPLLGTALTATVTKAGLLSGGFLAVAGKLAGFGVAIGAAAFVGVKVGKWLDKTLNISTRIGDGMASLYNRIRGINAKAAADNKRKFVMGSGRLEVQNILNVLRAGKSKSIMFRGAKRGDRSIISRELAERRARLALTKKGVTGAAQEAEIQKLLPLLQQIPKLEDVRLNNAEVLREARRGFKVTINMDGKVVATAVAGNAQEAGQRGSRGTTNRSIAAGRAG